MERPCLLYELDALILLQQSRVSRVVERVEVLVMEDSDAYLVLE